MKQINIKDKNNIEYTIEIVEDSFKNEVINNSTKWSVKYRVKNKTGDMLGYGGFYLNCSLAHEHLENEKIFNSLIALGAQKVKVDIDDDETIESKGYNMHAIDCQHIME